MNLEYRIYRMLMEVPPGQVTTYGDLARAVGLKNGQRIVGRVMNKNPYPVIVPCHRVVMSTGRVGGYAYGEHVKAKMLNDEGVQISDGRVRDLGGRLYRFSRQDAGRTVATTTTTPPRRRSSSP